MYRIFVAAKGLNYKGPALGGWAKIFSLKATDAIGVFACLTAIQEEMARARSEFEQLHTFSDLNHDPIPKLVTIIQQSSLQQQWTQVVQQIDSASMSALGLIARTLPVESAGAEVNDDDLEKLAGKVDELVAETLETGLDERLCKMIVERLHAIKTAILMYKVYGNRGLDIAMQAVVGSVILNPDPEGKKAPRSFVKKLTELVQTIQTLIHTADAVRGLSNLAGLLTG